MYAVLLHFDSDTIAGGCRHRFLVTYNIASEVRRCGGKRCGVSVGKAWSLVSKLPAAAKRETVRRRLNNARRFCKHCIALKRVRAAERDLERLLALSIERARQRKLFK